VAASRSRPCLLLLPGILCDRRIFRAQSRALRAVADVVIPDTSRIREVRKWLDGLLQRLPRRFGVAGLPRSGLGALELLRLALHCIERLALIGSNAEPASPRAYRRRRYYWCLWRSQGPAALARQVKPTYFQRPTQRRRHSPLVREMALAMSTRAARAQFDWGATRDSVLALWSRFAGPALIVSGVGDQLCPPALQRRLAHANPRAHWDAFARCGHFIPLERPAALNASLRARIATPAQATRDP